MSRIARVRSIASFSLALPGFERCERPSNAPLNASGVQPGRLAQGPDEKKGRAGRTAGRLPVICHSFQNERTPLGERGPRSIYGFAEDTSIAIVCIMRFWGRFFMRNKLFTFVTFVFF